MKKNLEVSKKIGLLLDFDRTASGIKKYRDLGPFELGWTSRFTRHDEIRALKLRPEYVRQRLKLKTQEIRQNPERYAWLRDGYYVCAASDEFLRVGVLGQEILDEYEHLLDLSQRQLVLDEIYRLSYPFAEHELRPDASPVLNQLREAKIEIEIMTNSDPEKVREIIRESSARLGQAGSLNWLLNQVRGFAQKGTITPTEPLDIPPVKRIPGLQRPIFLRRGHAIAAARKFAADKKQVFVVDDNPELGLHWALALGFEAVLIVNEDTPAYEVAYFSRTPSCHVIYNLTELVEIILG